MRCPSCGFDNLSGSDICDNCGADLAGHDTPQPATSYRGPLLGEHLDELGVPAPEIMAATDPVDAAVRRMHETGSDCVLVVDDRRLVGIFTDRDAVLKVAGRPVGDRPLADLMTHDPVVLRHDDTIAVAIHKMAVGGFRHIPIVDGTHVPTGVVTARDVFRHLAQTVG
jgi:CBS domain-containing protein